MKLHYITLKGEEHPLCYNLQAAAELIDEFGGLDAWQAALNGANNVMAIAKTLKILLNGGRAYCEEMGISMPQPVKNAAAVIDISSPEAVKAIFGAIASDTDREVQTKNAVPTQED